jgi:hypothetical protein
MSDNGESASRPEDALLREVKTIAKPPALLESDQDESDDQPEYNESFTDILNTPVAKQIAKTFQENARQQAELAKQNLERQYSLERERLQDQREASKRTHEIEKQRLSADEVSRRWLRWSIAGTLALIATTFLYYRDTPDVAIKATSYIITVMGSIGVGYSARGKRE